MQLKTKSINIKDDFDNSFKVEYSLIESKIDDKKVYGFRVNSININDNSNLYREFLDFTTDLEYAKEIFENLVDNIVLPLNLINVLDEIVT